jgi:proteasome lid subunit RPN8/RPN11
MAFELGERVIKKLGSDMERLTLMSDKREHGFIICEKDGDIVKTGQCVGGECHIKLNKKCESGEKKLGDFHTHPDGKSQPSETDLILGHWKNHLVDCIGSVEKKAESPIREGLIRCFNPDSNYDWYEKKFVKFSDALEKAINNKLIPSAEKRISTIV